MPDYSCVGRCGNAVANKTTCFLCKKYCHPGCLDKHSCDINKIITDLSNCIQALQKSVNILTEKCDKLSNDNIALKTLLVDVANIKSENLAINTEI